MIEAQPYPHEHSRIAATQALRLVDTPIEERFERITRMVCRTLDVPMALFNLLDGQQQYYKSVQGIAATTAPLEAAFCTHAILENDMLLIPDASKDKRFHDNPHVTGGLAIRFYAGCPVHAPDGMPVGTLCAIDTRPRDLTMEQLTTLHDLAVMVETEIKVINLSKTQRGLIQDLDNANRLALIDPLTRLWNRNGITKIIEREWQEALRRQSPVTLVMCDIDHFKWVNDAYGHEAGDFVLKGVAKKMLESLRGEDAVGRMGGEEFLVFLNDPKLTSDQTMKIIERLRHTISQHVFEFSPVQHQAVTMSFGVARTVPQQGERFEPLIGKADKALYRAKHAGRNRVECAQ